MTSIERLAELSEANGPDAYAEFHTALEIWFRANLPALRKKPYEPTPDEVIAASHTADSPEPPNEAPQAGQDNAPAPSQEGHATGPAVAAPIPDRIPSPRTDALWNANGDVRDMRDLAREFEIDLGLERESHEITKRMLEEAEGRHK